MDSLFELRELVGRFVAHKASYAEFREGFVVGFLSVKHEHPLIDGLVGLIERACSDFEDGDIERPYLDDELSVVMESAIAVDLSAHVVRPLRMLEAVAIPRHEAFSPANFVLVED